jgi:Nickel responsive protein SCO4226-like
MLAHQARLYTAKCYWPGITEDRLGEAALRVLREGECRCSRGRTVLYLGSLLFVHDDLVLCLYSGPSRAAVKQANERAGFPCERVMESVWLARPQVKARMR